MKNDPQEVEQQDNPRERMGWLKQTWHRKFNWLTAVKRGTRGYQSQSKHVNGFGLRTTKKYANQRQMAAKNRVPRKYRKGGHRNRRMHQRIRNRR